MLTILPQEPPESGWWLARLGAGAASKVGLVPGTYLQRVATPTAATPPPPPPQAPPPGGVAEVSGGIALALADFSAEEGEELSVALGDMLTPTGAPIRRNSAQFGAIRRNSRTSAALLSLPSPGRDAPDGWLHVVAAGGAAGLVPREFVRLQPAPMAYTMERASQFTDGRTEGTANTR